jgi:hypothetical protein
MYTYCPPAWQQAIDIWTLSGVTKSRSVTPRNVAFQKLASIEFCISDYLPCAEPAKRNPLTTPRRGSLREDYSRPSMFVGMERSLIEARSSPPMSPGAVPYLLPRWWTLTCYCQDNGRCSDRAWWYLRGKKHARGEALINHRMLVREPAAAIRSDAASLN